MLLQRATLHSVPARNLLQNREAPRIAQRAGDRLKLLVGQPHLRN
jgi:hypothetical protein